MVTMVQGVNLVKVYPMGTELVRAVDDVTIEIYPGEMVAVIGKNFAGKSSLLHVLGCLQRPDSGQMRIDGIEVAEADDAGLLDVRLDKVGFVFQAFNLLTNQTVLTNVEAPLWENGMFSANRREKAAEALGFVGLSRRMQYLPGQLSQNQRQLVAIARALVTNPKVIIVDEPTKGLDGTGRHEVMGILQRVNDKGTTVIIATAEPSVARYCRRMLRIEEGKIIEDQLVSRRHLVPLAETTESPTDVDRGINEAVCPRCNHGNPREQKSCRRCKCPLDLTDEEEQFVADRLSGRVSKLLGVESDIDEGKGPQQNNVEELKKVPVFAEFGTKNLVKILHVLEQCQFPRGSTIIKQGDEGDSFYVIRRGKVEIVLGRGAEESITVAKLGPMEGFGEMALLSGKPRSANVVAVTDVETWRLPKADFEALLSENISMGIYFGRIVTRRLIALQNRITA